MGKRILVTAGPVYGRLDDNKLVSNRSRGIWAINFAHRMCEEGHEVALLIPDVLKSKDWSQNVPGLEVLYHKGFEEYEQACYDLANSVDASVMAAAVLNWIPANPVKGKMNTKGYEEGDIIQIPFKLAPHVINQMRTTRCKCVIGCKLLSGATLEELIDAAYGVLLKGRCSVVVANDLSDLKTKHLVFPDRSVMTFKNDWKGLYAQLQMLITDVHYRTHTGGIGSEELEPYDVTIANIEFDEIARKYRDRFTNWSKGDIGHTFGAIAVHVANGVWLCSPRKKEPLFTSKDAVLVKVNESTRTVLTLTGKATLNAPHMIGMGEGHKAQAVLHLHEPLEGVDTLPYTPPGTVRDMRCAWGPNGLPRAYNIEGHGFVACLDENNEIILSDYRVGKA